MAHVGLIENALRRQCHRLESLESRAKSRPTDEKQQKVGHSVSNDFLQKTSFIASAEVLQKNTLTVYIYIVGVERERKRKRQRQRPRERESIARNQQKNDKGYRLLRLNHFTQYVGNSTYDAILKMPII